MRIISTALYVSLACLSLAQAPKLQVWEKSLSPGLTYRMEVDTDAPLIVNALRFSPRAPGIKAIPELAGRTINESGSVKGRLTPTQMAVQESAVAAVNGDFFSFTQGAPIGLMVREGQLLTTPLKARAVFGWGPQTSSVGYCTTTVTLTPDGEEPIKVDAINQPCGANEIALYTPAEGIETSPAGSATAMVTITNSTWGPSTVILGSIDTIATDLPESKVADGRAMIVATGDKKALVMALKSGQNISIQTKTDGFDWEKIENVIGGGPVLVKKGKIAVDAEAEGFPAAFYAKRHPRTAIGRTADGDIWLVTIDGRQEISVGATLEETARVMQRLGCADAMNLDGGGSTCLHVMGVTVNRPSDGVERPVSNGVLVFAPRIPDYRGHLKMSLAPKIALGAPVTASLQLDGRAVPNSDVVWGAQGSAWIDQGGALHPLELGKTTIRASAYGQVLTFDATVVEKLPVAKPAHRRR